MRGQVRPHADRIRLHADPLGAQREIQALQQDARVGVREPVRRAQHVWLAARAHQPAASRRAPAALRMARDLHVADPQATRRGEQRKAQGACGGRDGGLNRVRIVRGGKPYVPKHLSKDQDIRIVEGDVIEVSTPGGGGFGDPLKRDPQCVAQDVARGYYNREPARGWVGVVLRDDGSVDAGATHAHRGNP